MKKFLDLGLQPLANSYLTKKNLNLKEKKFRLEVGFDPKNYLVSILNTVSKVLERSEKLDYLIVETTGLADPLPVAMTFAAGDLREKVRLDSIITVIDGENFDFEINNKSVAYSQILYGDILLLNKCDLVNEEKLKKLHNAIKPLLANLKQNPDKEYILWPNRVQVIEKFESHLADIVYK